MLDHASVCEEHVELALCVLDRRIEPIEVEQLGRVALNGGDIAADEGDGLVQFGLSAAEDEDASALIPETLGRGEPDTAVAASDDSNLALYRAMGLRLERAGLAQRRQQFLGVRSLRVVRVDLGVHDCAVLGDNVPSRHRQRPVRIVVEVR